MLRTEKYALKFYTFSQYQQVFGEPSPKEPDLQRYNCPDRWTGKKIKIES